MQEAIIEEGTRDDIESICLGSSLHLRFPHFSVYSHAIHIPSA